MKTRATYVPMSSQGRFAFVACMVTAAVIAGAGVVAVFL
jgi:hypothetical protein